MSEFGRWWDQHKFDVLLPILITAFFGFVALMSGRQIAASVIFGVGVAVVVAIVWYVSVGTRVENRFIFIVFLIFAGIVFNEGELPQLVAPVSLATPALQLARAATHKGSACRVPF